MRPVVEARVQCLLDQQSTHARAINEEIASDALAAFEHHGVDETIGITLDHLGNLALGAPHAALFGEAAQEARIQSRVKMECVRDIGHR